MYHTFSVSKPTVFDFVYSVDSGSDITMRLLNLDGEPFVFNNKDSVVMYEGGALSRWPTSQGSRFGRETMPWRFLPEAPARSLCMSTVESRVRQTWSISNC